MRKRGRRVGVGGLTRAGWRIGGAFSKQGSSALKLRWVGRYDMEP
jgi:hypothetical protein